MFKQAQLCRNIEHLVNFGTDRKTYITNDLRSDASIKDGTCFRRISSIDEILPLWH